MTFILAQHWYQLILCALLVPAVYGLLWLHKRWTRAERELSRLLPFIHDGSVPIDELLKIEGRFKNLALSMHDILRDLRQQKSAVMRLEMEVHQRVANKTDALQRTIGSLRLQASKDAVTGLYNRRMLDQILPELADRTRATGSHLTLLMIDLDYFKDVNDTLGHAAGDQLLITVSQIIRSGIRDNDMAFRYGGDEFVVLMPEADLAQGKALAERLSTLVSIYAKTLHLPIPPGLSIGVACTLDLENSSAAHLLRHADEELYKIKEARPIPSRRGAA